MIKAYGESRQKKGYLKRNKGRRPSRVQAVGQKQTGPGAAAAAAAGVEVLARPRQVGRRRRSSICVKIYHFPHLEVGQADTARPAGITFILLRQHLHQQGSNRGFMTNTC